MNRLNFGNNILKKTFYMYFYYLYILLYKVRERKINDREYVNEAVGIKRALSLVRDSCHRCSSVSIE